jgi:hypothetical protein
LGAAWAWSMALAGNFFFSWHPLWGLRAGAVSLVPALLGFAWPLILRFPVPPPHDLPVRKLEILLAAQTLLSLWLALGMSLFGLVRSGWLASQAPGHAVLRLFGLAWLVYLASGLWVGQWNVTGDSPHYLLITHSLAYEQDVELSKNYMDKDWRRFYDRAQLQPQVPAQKDGRQYAEHKPGLPLVLAPAYRALGQAGAVWMLAAMAALGGALLYLLLLRLGFSWNLSLLGWALLSFTAPWWAHSSIVLVEMAGGLLMLAGLAALKGALPGWLALLFAACLPWLSVRYNFPALALATAFGLVHAGKRPARLILSWGITGLSLLGVWAFEARHFASLNPAESYSQRNLGLSDLIKPWDIPRHVSGLLLDQEYGWLPFAPVFFLSFLGLWSWWRRDRAFFWQMAGISLAYLGPVACFPWWFGDMAPNRYLVCLAPVFCLTALEAWRAWGNRAGFALLATISFAWGILMTILPWLCWSKQNGQNWLLRIAGKMVGLNLTAFFPSFMIPKPDSYLWVLALVLLLGFGAKRLGSPGKRGNIK